MATSDRIDSDVLVIGGGIAGLTAAIYAARAGARVRLLERHSELGGRARTRFEHGFGFNFGPHALYRGGAAEATLTDLGIPLEATAPELRSALAAHAGELLTLPLGVRSLLGTRLLGASEKLAFGGLLARLPRIDPEEWQDRTLAEFLDRHTPTPTLRALLEALFRLTTYANASHSLSAGFALAQLQLALRGGVRYVHHGWQRMIQDLEHRARELGVEITSGVSVRSLLCAGGSHPRASGSDPERGRIEVRTRVSGPSTASSRAADSTAANDPLRASAVVLALPPREVLAIAPDAITRELRAFAETCTPVCASVLEVGLSLLPAPDRRFALGIDRPSYASLHSSVPGLAPEGGANFQLAWYCDPHEKPENHQVESCLENLLDQLQPGWREHTRIRRLLRELCVAQALPVAASGGLRGRPEVRALLRPGQPIFLAGDWVGPLGWLADGSFASGREAGDAAGRSIQDPARSDV